MRRVSWMWPGLVAAAVVLVSVDASAGESLEGLTFTDWAAVGGYMRGLSKSHYVCDAGNLGCPDDFDSASANGYTGGGQLSIMRHLGGQLAVGGSFRAAAWGIPSAFTGELHQRTWLSVGPRVELAAHANQGWYLAATGLVGAIEDLHFGATLEGGHRFRSTATSSLGFGVEVGAFGSFENAHADFGTYHYTFRALGANATMTYRY